MCIMATAGGGVDAAAGGVVGAVTSGSVAKSSSTRNNNNNNDAAHCSRSLSRKIRKFVDHEIFSKLSIDPLALPDNCQLNPKYDLFRDQESHKVEYTRTEWRCQYCHKQFKNERYLDKHMDHKHEDKLAVRLHMISPCIFIFMLSCSV
jgi:hypothetical protein